MTTWTDDAACRGLPVDSFVVDGVYGLWASEYAKKVCAHCPVTRQCLDFAYQTDDKHTVLGGLTPNERQKRRN